MKKINYIIAASVISLTGICHVYGQGTTPATPTTSSTKVIDLYDATELANLNTEKETRITRIEKADTKTQQRAIEKEIKDEMNTISYQKRVLAANYHKNREALINQHFDDTEYYVQAFTIMPANTQLTQLPFVDYILSNIYAELSDSIKVDIENLLSNERIFGAINLDDISSEIKTTSDLTTGLTLVNSVEVLLTTNPEDTSTMLKDHVFTSEKSEAIEALKPTIISGIGEVLTGLNAHKLTRFTK